MAKNAPAVAAFVWEGMNKQGKRAKGEISGSTLALVKADDTVVSKIKSNISERAAATIDEEMSLMSAPKQEDILGGRGEIVKALREMNDNDELNFVEE